jgi:hypothetical protein
MALPAMITLNGMGRCFALDQLVLRDDRRIRRPLIRAIQLYIPLYQAIDQLLQGGFVTLTTFPVRELTRVTIESLPDPELAPLLLEIVPHLIQLQDDRFSRGAWLLIVLCGKGPDPVEHGLSRDPYEERDTMHGNATQIQKHRVEWSG